MLKYRIMRMHNVEENLVIMAMSNGGNDALDMAGRSGTLVGRKATSNRHLPVEEQQRREERAEDSSRSNEEQT
ncbi:hypothetical protein L917_02990, partial [Phytophthora nicotianae]